MFSMSLIRVLSDLVTLFPCNFLDDTSLVSIPKHYRPCASIHLAFADLEEIDVQVWSEPTEDVRTCLQNTKQPQRLRVLPMGIADFCLRMLLFPIAPRLEENLLSIYSTRRLRTMSLLQQDGSCTVPLVCFLFLPHLGFCFSIFFPQHSNWHRYSTHFLQNFRSPKFVLHECQWKMLKVVLRASEYHPEFGHFLEKMLLQ